MLNHNAIRVAVAAMAVLMYVTFNDDALGQPFATGDFVTYRQVDWGDADPIAAALLANPSPFNNVYPLGHRVGVLGVPGLDGGWDWPNHVFVLLAGASSEAGQNSGCQQVANA